MVDPSHSRRDTGPERDAQLAGYAAALADAVDATLGDWVRRVVSERCRQSGVRVTDDVRAAADRAADRCVAEVAPRVRALLATDPDEQASTPLTCLRSAVVYPTEVLRALGVPAVRRDDFHERAFPDDLYDLTPAGFADIDPALAEPGLVWGAAKAHVHLARRRDDGLL